MADYGLKTILTNLDIATPGNDEIANKLTAAIREIKYFLVNYLAVAHNADGSLLDGSINTAAKIGPGIITGTQVAGTTIAATNIAANAVTESKILDSAVTSGKLGASAVIAGKIAADAVTETTILNGAVTVNKIGAGAVIATKLASDSVESAKILAGAVINAKLGANAVTGDKLYNTSPTPPGVTGAAGTPLVAVAAGAVSGMLPVGGILSATVVSGVLTFAFSAPGVGSTTSNYLRLGRVFASGTNGAGTVGASGAGADKVLKDWSFMSGNAALVNITATELLIGGGEWLIWIESPAYKSDGHQVRLEYDATGTGGWTVVTGGLGTSAWAPAASSIQTLSTVMVAVVTTQNTKFRVVHWTAASDAAGLGLPVTSGNQETYATFSILKLK